MYIQRRNETKEKKENNYTFAMIEFKLASVHENIFGIKTWWAHFVCNVHKNLTINSQHYYTRKLQNLIHTVSSVLYI